MNHQNPSRWSDSALAAAFKFLLAIVFMIVSWNLVQPYVVPSLVLASLVAGTIGVLRFWQHRQW